LAPRRSLGSFAAIGNGSDFLNVREFLMTKLTLPGEIGQQLVAVHACVALCDDSGKTIGYFTPAVSDNVLDPQISEEELDRREREDRTFSSNEVRARIQSL
jgi:hypothetical protein